MISSLETIILITVNNIFHGNSEYSVEHNINKVFRIIQKFITRLQPFPILKTTGNIWFETLTT